MTDNGAKLFPDAIGHDDRRPDQIENKERGCGHLEPGKAYIRGVVTGRGGGVLPSFVKCDPPIPFHEIGTEGSFTRSYKHIDGLTLQLATEGDVCRYVPLSPNSRYEDIDTAWDRMASLGLYETRMDIPESETQRHIDRVHYRGPEGDHWGNIPTAGQTDLLMRAGESYYPDPDEFIQEARQRGLSKAIPIGPNREPPQVVPGITRCWIMHPAALDDGKYGGGIIGYVYLDDVVFTEPEEGDVPQYVTDLESQGKIRTVEIGPEEPANNQNTDLSDFEAE